MKKEHKFLGAAAAVVLAIVGTITITLTLTNDENGPGITITLGGPHGTKEHEIVVPKAAVDAAKSTDLDDHEKLRTENPPGVTPSQLDASREQQERLATAANLPNVTPDAAPQQRGCQTRLVQNFSSRRGVPPRVFVLHYTVSSNRPGWSDVYAISSLFDRPAFSASSNYVIDNEGNCAYIVRESDKAWTQAAANPFSISVEIINTGHEPTLAAKAGLEKIVLVADDALRRWKIPVQAGLVSGCVVKRSGIVDHHSLGACGGGHFDITPYSATQVIAAVKKHRGLPPVPPQLPLCTVRVLQQRLGITADGIVGPKTRAAIRAFQTKHGFVATGYAGVKVSAALRLRGCAI